MTFKERLLEWLIRPERYYIRRYLRFLRQEEKYTLGDTPNKLLGLWYRGRKNRLGSRLGFIISAGCFGEDLHLEHFGSVIVNPKSRIGKGCIIHGNCCIGSNGGYPDDSPSSGTTWTSGRMLRYWEASGSQTTSGSERELWW